MYKLSKTSQSRLDTCDDYIVKVIEKAIELSPIDFGVAQGSRTIAQQRQYFNDGKSKINPDNYDVDVLPQKAKHIVTADYPKAGAVDIYGYVNGATWDAKVLCHIAGVIMAVDKMYENRLRWGGNWDGDGEIITDQTFQDLPHFELRERTI
jgi:peptidoglycan L-alanyl-D-glutamate endopeptidase CwlK